MQAMARTSTTPTTCWLALCGLFAALTGGCKQEPLCAELGACGGLNPIGTWQLSVGHPSCSEDLYIPPTDPRLLGGEVVSARQPVIEPAFFDWCYLLVTNGGEKIQARPPRFYYESGPIGWASITYDENWHYTVGVSRTGTYVLDFPAMCMREFGATDGRPALDAAGMPVGAPTDVCKQLEVPLGDSGIGEGSYPNVLCIKNPADELGCLCQFDVTETGGGSGTYSILDDHTLMHLPFNNFPQKTTFCNTGNSLELTGSDGEYLFGQRGLRTMSLGKAVAVADPCINGLQDTTEAGIDCGGTCPNACPAAPVPQ